MKKQSIAQTIRALLLPHVTSLGYILWDVEYVKEGADQILRITLDSPDGININDCERVHRAADTLLDEADPIENSYRLEVTSPGIERELRTPEHLRAYIGETVRARFFAPQDGKKEITATLAAYDETTDTLTIGTQTIPRAAVSKINTVFDW